MAKSTQFTSKQRQAIDERYDEMLVSASAGSGKTTVMIERIVSLILEGAELKNMAVATFTKSAAADMRSKLYKRLVLLGNEGNAYAEKQLRALQTAQISTLHSFCQQLIKTYFYAIKTDPDFSILSETDAKVLLSECIEREIEKRLEGGDSDFAIIYEVMLQNRKTTALSECINKLYEFASVQPDFDEWIFSATQNIDKHNEHIKELKNELESDFEFIALQADLLLQKIVQANFVRNQKAAEELCDAVRMRERCNAKAYGKLPDDFYLLDLNSEFSTLKKEYNALFDKLGEIEQSSDPTLALPYTKVLLDMTRSVKDEYSRQKQKNGFKDYSDLEHDALKILKNGEVKKQIDAKYLYLFVDEYQDINPLQESIITHFSAKKFFVGDVKQSIYSFRMCTPEIFISKKSRLKDDGKGVGLALELNSNFRSKKGILAFCNEVFSSIMTSDFGGCDYKNEAAFVFNEEDETASFGISDAALDEVASTESAQKSVELFLVSGENDDTQAINKVYSVKEHEEKTKLYSLKDAEIHLIISHIAKLIMPKAGGGTGADFKDIAILLRSVSGSYAKSLADALNLSGIPAFLQEKKEATDSTAVAALIAFLSLIDNHNDDISLASVLRSPFGGFTDEELAQIKLNYSGSSRFYYDAVRAAIANDKLDALLRARLQRFFDDLERYTVLAYSKNASQILGDVCAEFDYFKYVFARKNGDSAAKELAAFLSFAEESVFKSSVGEFVSALSRQMPKLEHSANANAVKIMTIHSSKGLEFPHVIMGNLNKEYNLKDLYGTLLLDSKLGAALKVWDLNNHEKLNSSLALRVRAVLKKRLCEEEARILYVALTRAKDSLALIASVKDIDKVKKLKGPSRANSFF